MLSVVDLEVMKSTNPEISWKSVTKGRRSKSIARSLNGTVKAGNSISPKRVGDFSGSDSDRFSEVIPGQATSGKSGNVPLKKRRHLLQSPSHHPSVLSSSPNLEDRVLLQYPSCSAGAGDFFGIELLAAAASMDICIDDADKKDILPVNSSVQKNSDVSSSATLSEQFLKHNESVDSFSKINVPGGNVNSQENVSSTASQSLSANPEDGTTRKVERKHWDLNTSIDAWAEPYDDSISGDTLKDVNGGRHLEEMKKHFGDHVSSNQTAIEGEKAILKMEHDRSTSAAEDGMLIAPPHPKESSLDPTTFIYSRTVKDNSNQACQRDPDDKNLIKAIACDAELKRLNQVTSLDATIGVSPFNKLCGSSGLLNSEEKNNAISGTVAMIQQGDCSISISECERTAAMNGSQTDQVNCHGPAASESAIDVKPEDIEVYPKTSSPGTAELGTKHVEDCVLPNGNAKNTVLVDTCKSSSSGAQCDESNIIEGIGLALDGQHNSYISQANNVGMVHEDDLTVFQEGYDSPYEDGELRGSFLYSWEDNEMKTKSVDYESDGRNGDGSDAADYNGSEIVKGGSEGSNGSLGSKTGNVKHALKKHAVKAESDSNNVAGKGSNAGSVSTIEQCVEMHVDENDGMKRLELLDHKNNVDVMATHVGEYASKAVKVKLQSRIEGRSYEEATDRKDASFIQQSRSRRFAGLYPRLERDKYRSGAPGERDGIHQLISWGSSRCYTTNYQGGEGRNNTNPRSKIRESASKIEEVDYHEPRQTNYVSKGLHRPLMRRSPVERDYYFGVSRRVPLTRGSRGHYSQHPGRDFVEDFEPLHDNSGASVRMPHYISRMEHSFSPGPGRQTYTSLTRRRSRSRSRTRSLPGAWQNSQREQIFVARRLNRSPDFKSDSRMRMPFPKAEGYISTSKGRFSPQQWVEDNHTRRRRSPVRAVIWGAGRLSLGKLKSGYDYRRRVDGYGEKMSDRVCQFWYDGLETKYMTDDFEREDKKAFKI